MPQPSKIEPVAHPKISVLFDDYGAEWQKPPGPVMPPLMTIPFHGAKTMSTPCSDEWSQYFRLLHAIEQKGLLVNRANIAIKRAGSLGLFHGKVLLGPRVQLPGLQDADYSPCYRSAIITNLGIGPIWFISPLDDWENPNGPALVSTPTRKPELMEIPSGRKETGLAQFWHTSNIRRAL